MRYNDSMYIREVLEIPSQISQMDFLSIISLSYTVNWPFHTSSQISQKPAHRSGFPHFCRSVD